MNLSSHCVETGISEADAEDESAQPEPASTPTRPLPPGAVIDYMGERATVVEDRGDSVGIKVRREFSSDTTEWWAWSSEGTECTVVSMQQP